MCLFIYFQKMSLSWLNNDFLSLILKASCENESSKTEDFRIVDFKSNRIVEEENYTSLMYKVQVWFKEKSKEGVRDKSFVFKSVLPLTNQVFVDKETLTYMKVLPKIEEYLSQKFAPKLLFFSHNALVMENIRDHGFKNVNSFILLDYNHCIVALQALAKFHAGSVLLHQREPELVEKKVGWDICVNNPDIDVINFLTNTFYTFETEISTWPEARHHVSDFKFVREHVRDYFLNINNRKHLKVLNHGDFWLNNLMFRYDLSGNVRDVRMVDFQGCRYCSPACDVQYFIASSSNLDVRLNRLNDLYDAYLKMLNESLSQLKLPQRLKRHEFYDSLNQEYMMYFIGLVLSLCTCLNDPKDRINVEGYESMEEMGNDANLKFASLLQSPRYKNFITPVLDDISNKGAFLR